MCIVPSRSMRNHLVEPDRSDKVGDTSETLVLDFTFSVICIDARQNFEIALTVGLPKYPSFGLGSDTSRLATNVLNVPLWHLVSARRNAGFEKATVGGSTLPKIALMVIDRTKTNCAQAIEAKKSEP